MAYLGALRLDRPHFEKLRSNFNRKIVKFVLKSHHQCTGRHEWTTNLNFLMGGEYGVAFSKILNKHTTLPVVGVARKSKRSPPFPSPSFPPFLSPFGQFNRICQVADMCPHMRAHWRHLANTIELVLLSAHPSPQPKLQIDRFSRFCTDDRRVSYTLQRFSRIPLKIFPFPWGYLDLM